VDTQIIRQVLQNTNNNIPQAYDILKTCPPPNQAPILRNQIEIITPDYWTNQTQETEFVEMDLNCDLAVDIIKNFLEKLNGNVLRLWRIQNLRLWRWYYLMKQEILQRSVDANEKLVWHGTDINNIDDIVSNGFDVRLARDGAIGQGIYFAASAGTSLSYVKNGDRMILCRVALGNTTTGHRSLRRPPLIKPGLLYDSVDGRIGDDTMFCLFDNRQCYPEFVIEYQLLPQQKAEQPPQFHHNNHSANNNFGFNIQNWVGNMNGTYWPIGAISPPSNHPSGSMNLPPTPVMISSTPQAASNNNLIIPFQFPSLSPSPSSNINNNNIKLHNHPFN
jgi:hypothetical protein